MRSGIAGHGAKSVDISLGVCDNGNKCPFVDGGLRKRGESPNWIYKDIRGEEFPKQVWTPDNPNYKGGA